jgi:hypothetical protein
MHSPPVKYLILIEAAGAMQARLFDAQRRHVADLDSATEEIPGMLTGLRPTPGADPELWGSALKGHSEAECREAQVYTLPV